MPRKKEKDLEQQLNEFLERWISERVKLVEKYTSRAEFWKRMTRPGWDLPYSADMRRAKHHEHELEMLRELKKRSLK